MAAQQAAYKFASGNVSGLFFVSMDVIDSSGVPVQQISRQTRNLRHIIRVENFSGLKQNVRVTARLPNGMLRLDFFNAAAQPTTTDRWQDAKTGVASGSTVDFVHRVRRTNGPNDPSEPIECEDVADALGTLNYNSGSCGVPFSMTIAAT